jgi:FAD:protein FMN transferase
MTLEAKQLPLWAASALMMLLFTACNRNDNGRVQLLLSGEAQGTYYRILYYDELGRNFTQEVVSLLETVDKSVSVYLPDSRISLLNRNETNQVDSIFAENFHIAKKVSIVSNGAFDCTIGRLIEAWGWGFSKRDSITPELIDSLREIAGYHRVSIEDDKLIKDDPRITINFNAIAQGYTSDVIARFLLSRGVENFLIDVGGELVAQGLKPGRNWWNKSTPWVIGVELPGEGDEIPDNLMDRPVKALLTLNNKGVATSGNYRKFYLEDGTKYSHTLDPATGYPVKHTLLSATVVAENATLADAWATAFMVVGVEKAQEILEENPDMEAYFIYADQKGNDVTWFSPGLKKMIQEIE